MPWRITPADYASIRAVIDTTLTEGSLPVGVISLPIYTGQAEATVLGAYPLADTAAADVQVHLHNAALLFCAASLVMAIPVFVREQGPEFSAQVERVPPSELAADLRNRAQAELAIVASEGVIGDAPLVFATVPGARGRW